MTGRTRTAAKALSPPKPIVPMSGPARPAPMAATTFIAVSAVPCTAGRRCAGGLTEHRGSRNQAEGPAESEWEQPGHGEGDRVAAQPGGERGEEEYRHSRSSASISCMGSPVRVHGGGRGSGQNGGGGAFGGGQRAFDVAGVLGSGLGRGPVQPAVQGGALVQGVPEEAEVLQPVPVGR
jgi:hypothetical protein